MPVIRAGERPVIFSLDRGDQVLLIVGPGSSATITDDGMSQILGVVTNASSLFGPFETSKKIEIVCTTGSASFSVDGLSPSLYVPEGAIRPNGYDSAALQDAHDKALSEGKVLDLGGHKYYITSPISFRPNRVQIIGNDATLDCTGMTGAYAIRLESSSPDPKFDSKTRHLENIHFIGPGDDSGKTGIQVSGSVAERSSRPTFKNITMFDFGVCVDFINYAYLAQFYSCEFRTFSIAIRQSVGADAGEGCSMYGCTIFNGDLAFHLLEPSSEWFLHGTSIDYVDQLCVINGDMIRLHLINDHVEVRGGSGTGDGLYVLNGSGTDPRAVVAGRDSFIDVDGNGSSFIMRDSLFDINNSGGAGPYNFDHLVNLRNNTSKALFDSVTMQNMANTTNKFWTGTGQCVVTNTQTQHTPGMPSRITDQTFGNALRDGGIEDSSIPDLWYVSKDTASITSRLTGTNITLARSTVQKRTGSSSMLITKVASGSGQVSVLVPVIPGEKISVFGYSFLTAGAGGSIFADCRWASMIGLDANGVPIIQNAAGVSFHASATLSATTGSFQSFAIKTYDNGASGEPVAPAWATHARISFNLDGVTVGGTTLYIDDLHVSRW